MMTALGDPQVLKTTATRDPIIENDTDVLVKIHAAGVNPIDTKIRRNGPLQEHPLPIILGCDGAGEVVETGPLVFNLKPGDKVWYCHGGLGQEAGNYAQFNVVPSDVLRRMPENIDYTQAAAAPLILITAWESLRNRTQLQAGETLLIHAGAGGVGHVAIQLAKQLGAKVVVTVSNEAQEVFVKRLGADDVINYKTQNVTEAIMALTDRQGADVVFDCVGPAIYPDCLQQARHQGRVVSLLDPGDAMDTKLARTRNLSLSFELMLTPMLNPTLVDWRKAQGDILDQCRRLIEKNQLKVEVFKEYSLDQAAEAHKAIQEGSSRGKHVLKIVADK